MPDAFEEQQENSIRTAGRARTPRVIELAGRVRQKGVLTDGTESPAQLDDLLTSIDRFEAAVVARGGDLWFNTPTSSQPRLRSSSSPGASPARTSMFTPGEFGGGVASRDGGSVGLFCRYCKRMTATV